MAIQNDSFDALGGVPVASIPEGGAVRRLGTGFVAFLPQKEATNPPTSGDDVNDGFVPGSTWIDTVTGKFYLCTDNTVAAAVWVTLIDEGPSLTVTDSNHTVTRENRKIYVSTGASDRTMAMPAEASVQDDIFYFKKIDVGVGKVLFSVSIDGSASFALENHNDVAIITSDGTAYRLLSKVFGAVSANFLTGLYAATAATAVRDVVYLSSSDTVDQADADDALKQPVIGLVREKPTPTSAVVQYTGELGGFSGLTPGATYYLSLTPGQITVTAPSVPPDPANTLLQRIGYAKNATTLVILVDRDFIVLN